MKTGKQAGEELWESQSWHPTFKMAAESACERCVREIEADTVQGITEELQRLSVALTALCEKFERCRTAA